MPGPHNDDAPDIGQALQAELDEIVEEYGPQGTPESFERLASELERSATSYDGGSEAARVIAGALRQRAKAMRDAAV